VARRAARDLQDGAGIESTSVVALLRRLRVAVDRLPAGCVRVVDEAGMPPTRDLAELVQAVTHWTAMWSCRAIIASCRSSRRVGASAGSREGCR
jgi:hypothetical protein